MPIALYDPSGEQTGSRDGNILRDANGNRNGDIVESGGSTFTRDAAGNVTGRVIQDGQITRYYDTDGILIATSSTAPPSPSASGRTPHPIQSFRSYNIIGQGIVFIFFVILLILMLFAASFVVSVVASILSFALGIPLFSRVFIHPEARRFQMRNCAIALAISLFSVVLSILIPANTFTLGPQAIFYAAALVAGLAQRDLARRYPQNVDGSGYGLINLRSLFRPLPLTHRFDLLQDGCVAFVFALIFFVVGRPYTHFDLLILVPVALSVAYAGYCQRRFAALRGMPSENLEAWVESVAPPVPSVPVEPGSVADLVQRGRRLLTSGDVSGATALVRQAYVLDNTHPAVFVLASQVSTEPKQQLMQVKKALQIDPLYPEALDRYRELAAQLNLQVPPASPPVRDLVQKAYRLLAAGDRTGATQCVKDAYALDRTNPDVLVLTSRIIPDPTKQLSQVQKALQSDPLHTEALKRYRVLTGRVENNPHPPAIKLNTAPAARPLRTPFLIAGILGLLVIIAIGVVVADLLTHGGGTPDRVARTFIHALLTGDETAAVNALSNDSRAQTLLFCSPPVVACLSEKLFLPPNTQDVAAIVLSQTEQSAIAQVRLRLPNAGADSCLRVQLQNEAGWKVVDTLGSAVLCDTVQAALAPTQPLMATPAPALADTPSDPARQAVMQTVTQLALTRNAMLIGPSLTATVLAPGFTQTALVREQGDLNTALAATRTQISALITETALAAGMTSTAIVNTQTATAATQQAVLFKATLNGTLATSENITGQPQIVVMNADGSNTRMLSEIGIDPAWSPDGQRLAFVNREHGYVVHTMAADGTADTELTGPDFSFLSTTYPIWYPDGRQVMFEASPAFLSHYLYSSALNGTGLTKLLGGLPAGSWNSGSPDGKEILFTKNDQIWRVAVNGGTPRSVAKQAGAEEAAWSSDGQKIVFDAGNDLDHSLYVMNADGTNLQRITSKDVDAALPTWSPDGTHIAALCYDPHQHSNNVCVMNADGSNLTFITTAGGFKGRVSWYMSGNRQSPSAISATNTPPGVDPQATATAPSTNSLTLSADATLLTFSVGGGEGRVLQLWKANPDGSNPVALTDGSTFVFPGFSWSPDGQHIAFFGGRSQQFGLYVLDAVTNTFQTVIITGSEKTTQSYTVSWSPDGSAIAYMGDDGLYTITPDGKTVHRIVPLPVSSFHHSPIWSADSQKIAYVSDDDIYLVNRDGSGVKRVTTGKALQAFPSPGESATIQQLGSLITWTPDGRLAYTVAKLDGAVYTIAPDGTGVKLFLKQPYILAWSSDGKQLVGLRITSDLTVFGIYRLTPDGTGTPQRILKFGQFGAGTGVSSPVWRPYTG